MVISYKQGPDDYEEAVEDGSRAFQALLLLYLDGVITLAVLRERFRALLGDHYTRMMILGLGDSREITERDLAVLQGYLESEYEYLEGFLTDLEQGTITRDRALWRAGLYGFARTAYINFTIPPGVADLMPVLPGDDCLGGSLCGCSLDVEIDSDGTTYVYWVLDLAKETCAVCLAHAIESPFVFHPEDFENAS